MQSMKEKYGEKKGESVFYATANKQKDAFNADGWVGDREDRPVFDDFKEGEHKRDEGGKFSEGGGGGKVDHFAKKLSGQKGSNPGGVYKGSDGKERYVKFYKKPEQGRQEAAANSIYNDLGLGAPKSDIVDGPGGKEAFASELIKGGDTLEHQGLTKENCQEVLKGFAADVLTANWDAVGLTHDNILMKDGKANRIDNGSAFTFRAQGEPKPEHLLDQATEWDVFSSGKNREYNKVFQKAGYESAADIPDIKQQVQRIVDLEKKSGGWDSYLKERASYLSDKERGTVARMLTKRTEQLAQKAGVNMTGKAKDAAMQLRVGQYVGSSEWRHDGVGKVLSVSDSGAKIEVHEPAPSTASKYVWRTEWWPVKDWDSLKPSNSTTEKVDAEAARLARAKDVKPVSISGASKEDSMNSVRPVALDARQIPLLRKGGGSYLGAQIENWRQNVMPKASEEELKAVIANDPNGSKASMARKELASRGTASDGEPKMHALEEPLINCPVEPVPVKDADNCPRCKGTGSIMPKGMERPTQCPACKGSGKGAVQPVKDEEHEFVRNPSRREAVCAVCGKGQSQHGVKPVPVKDQSDQELVDKAKKAIKAGMTMAPFVHSIAGWESMDRAQLQELTKAYVQARSELSRAKDMPPRDDPNAVFDTVRPVPVRDEPVPLDMEKPEHRSKALQLMRQSKDQGAYDEGQKVYVDPQHVPQGQSNVAKIVEQVPSASGWYWLVKVGGRNVIMDDTQFQADPFPEGTDGEQAAERFVSDFLKGKNKDDYEEEGYEHHAAKPKAPMKPWEDIKDQGPSKWSGGWQPAEKPSGKPQPTPASVVSARLKAKAKDREVLPV